MYIVHENELHVKSKYNNNLTKKFKSFLKKYESKRKENAWHKLENFGSGKPLLRRIHQSTTKPISGGSRKSGLLFIIAK